jgi:hypothetical protein
VFQFEVPHLDASRVQRRKHGSIPIPWRPGKAHHQRRKSLTIDTSGQFGQTAFGPTNIEFSDAKDNTDQGAPHGPG